MKKRTKIMSAFILLALVGVGVLQFKKMNEEALEQKEKEKIEQEKARIAKETALEEARIAKEAEGKITFTHENELVRWKEIKIDELKNLKFYDLTPGYGLARIRSWELGNNLVASYSIVNIEGYIVRSYSGINTSGFKNMLMLKKLIKRKGAEPLFALLDYVILDNNRTIASIKNCRKNGVIDKNLVGFYDTLKYMNEPEVSEFIKMYRFNLEARKIVEVEKPDGIECDNPHIEKIEKMVEESYKNWIDGVKIFFVHYDYRFPSYSGSDKYDKKIDIDRIKHKNHRGSYLYIDTEKQKAEILLIKPIDYTIDYLGIFFILLDSKQIKYEEGLIIIDNCQREDGIEDKNIIGIFNNKFWANEWIVDFKYVFYEDHLNDRLVEISTAGIKCKNEDYIKYLKEKEKKEKINKLQQDFPEKYPKFVDGKQAFNSIFELENYDEKVYEISSSSSAGRSNTTMFFRDKENDLKGRVVLLKEVYRFGKNFNNEPFYIILDEVEFKLNENPPSSFKSNKDYGFKEWFASRCYKDGKEVKNLEGVYFEEDNYDFLYQEQFPNLRKIYFFNIKLGKIEEIENHNGFTCENISIY